MCTRIRPALRVLVPFTLLCVAWFSSFLIAIPQAMLPWLSQGKPITLAPGDNVKIDAPLVTAPDTLGTGTGMGGTR